MLRETTVIVPPTTQDLITLSEYMLDWGLSSLTTWENQFLTKKITSMSQWFQRKCNRIFTLQTVEDSFYFRDDPDVDFLDRTVQKLNLSNKPIVSVLDVTVDGSQLSFDEYLLNTEGGYLLRIDSSGRIVNWCADKITVMYETGFSTIPSDIKDAISRLIYNRKALLSADAGVRSRQIEGVETVTYFANSDQIIDPDIADLITQYRLPSFG